MIDIEKLQTQARMASGTAYAPYSKFRVGAALLCKDGQIIHGCNVENRSFGLTNCAERSAIFTALSMGIRDFKAMAIYSPDCDEVLPPCGACRQVISEFVSGDFPLFLMGKDKVEKHLLGELFPLDSLHDLKGKI
ncbi:MAG: cytidine deaminase [Spirochaetaceae bacterium]|jgi:cytidine deaminase|nr:cytidine deaminase [Spirochaetaceae bacterium]